jgi:hypothetical protein
LTANFSWVSLRRGLTGCYPFPGRAAPGRVNGTFPGLLTTYATTKALQRINLLGSESRLDSTTGSTRLEPQPEYQTSRPTLCSGQRPDPEVKRAKVPAGYDAKVFVEPEIHAAQDTN